jgi:hypothetical protein
MASDNGIVGAKLKHWRSELWRVVECRRGHQHTLQVPAPASPRRLLGKYELTYPDQVTHELLNEVRPAEGLPCIVFEASTILPGTTAPAAMDRPEIDISGDGESMLPTERVGQNERAKLVAHLLDPNAVAGRTVILAMRIGRQRM